MSCPGKTDAPLERDIQAEILRWLRKRPGSFTVKLAAGPYSMPGLPDVLHIESGHAYFFEVKRPGGKATPLQLSVMGKLTRAGAVTSVVRSLEDVQTVIQTLCDAV